MGFPTTPSNGDQYTTSAGVIYQYVSAEDKWIIVGSITSDIDANVSNEVYGPSWDGISGIAPSKNSVYDKIESVITSTNTYADNKISDNVYSSGWNGDTGIAPSKNAIYDKIETLTLIHNNLSGLQGGTTNEYYHLTSGERDSVLSSVSDTGYSISWDGITTISPSKNAIYDKIETLVPNSRSINSHVLTGDVTITKSDVSLGNVDNVQQLPMSYLETTLTASDTKVGSSNAVRTYANGIVSNEAYGPTWDGATGIAPSKNTVYDKFEAAIISLCTYPMDIRPQDGTNFIEGGNAFICLLSNAGNIYYKGFVSIAGTYKAVIMIFTDRSTAVTISGKLDLGAKVSGELYNSPVYYLSNKLDDDAWTHDFVGNDFYKIESTSFTLSANSSIVGLFYKNAGSGSNYLYLVSIELVRIS